MSRRPNPPGGEWYGGAPINSIFDADGIEYQAGNVSFKGLPEGDPERFRFCVYRVDPDGTMHRLPLEDDKDHVAGRGFAYVDDSDGEGRYSCTEGKGHYDGVIPGFKPIVSGHLELSATGDAAVQALLNEISTLKARIVRLEQQAAPQVDLSPVYKRLGAVEGVANKANDRGLNALTQLAEKVYPRLDQAVSRDQAWQLAADRVYAEVTTDTAVRRAIEEIVRAAAAKIVVATTDEQARAQADSAQQIASEAHETATAALAEAMQKTTPEEVDRRVASGITAWLEASIAYVDRRLLNLLWDRGVKLVRYLKVPGADKAPVNDPNNISH